MSGVFRVAWALAAPLGCVALQGCGETKQAGPILGGNGGSAANAGSVSQSGNGGSSGRSDPNGGTPGLAGEPTIGGGAGDGGDANATTTAPQLHFSLAAPTPVLGGRWGKTLLADFNGDHQLDIAAAGTQVGIFLNKGSRELAPVQLYPIGSENGVSWAEAGDLNGDGLADLAASYVLDTTQLSARATAVLINQGDGTFGAPKKVADGAVLAIADFNGDNHGDLVVGDGLEGETVKVLLNDGSSRAFTLSGSFSAESGSLTAAVGDLNGDQKPDFAVATFNDDPVKVPELAGNVDVFLNQGTGTFKKAATYGLLKGAGDITIADFSGDGAADILATESLKSGSQTSVNLLVNAQKGSFADPLELPVGNNGGLAGALFTGDFDRNGSPDFGVAGGIDNVETALKLFKNAGKGTFEDAVLCPVARVTQVAAGDLDGDGALDLVTRDVDGGLELVFAYKDGSFPSTFGLTPAGAYPSLLLGDLNGDERPEVVVATQPGSSPGAMRAFTNHGDGTFGGYLDFIAHGPRQAALLDLNHDQKLDLAVAGSDVEVLLDAGSGFSEPVPYPSRKDHGTPELIAAGDLNGDHEPDLVVLDQPNFNDSPNAPDPLSVLLNQGNGVFGAPVSYPMLLTGRFSGTIALADLNGDGALDVSVAAGETAVSVFLNDGKGTLGPASKYRAQTTSLAVGDIDGDTHPDLIFAQRGEGPSVRFGLNDGNGPVEASGTLPSSNALAPSTVLLHDVNRDGKLDVLWGGARFLAIALGHGDATFDSALLYALPGTEPALRIAASDLNGDDTVDVVVQLDDGFVVLLNDGS